MVDLTSFLKPLRDGCLGALLLLGGCITPPVDKLEPPPTTGRSPAARGEPFWWGVSTSSYQNEDRGASPGSPGYFETDWDVFARHGHAPFRGEWATGGWSRFGRMVAAARELGVSHYRFSIEWARVEPRRGEFDEEAIAGYVRMARQLRAAGIEPVVTLWHFTFPDWLYHDGDSRIANYLDPGLLPAWERYVRRMVAALSPHVRIFVPENEPNGQLQLAYVGGHFPPGVTLGLGHYKKAMRVSVEMFRRAAGIVHAARGDALVMGIYALPHWRRNWLRDPTGAVYHAMERLNYDHLDQTHDVCDLVGVNYYFVQDADLFRFLSRHGEIGWKYTQLGWEIDAEGLYEVLDAVYRRYGKPIVITENGLATISEQKRIRYMREHINQMRRAIADGIDVRGYFAWTLLDNYEWREGWQANFGLAYLRRDGEVELTRSGAWLAEFIRSHPRP